jgi:hypothetical protein
MANLRYFGSKLPYYLMCCELYKTTPSTMPIYDHRVYRSCWHLRCIIADYSTPHWWLRMSGTSFETSGRLHLLRRALDIRRNISRRLGEHTSHILTTTGKFGNQQSIVDRSHPDLPLASGNRGRRVSNPDVVTFELRTGTMLSGPRWQSLSLP